MDPPASCRRLLCRRHPRPAIVIQRVVDRELQFHVVEVVPRDGLKPGRHRIQARGFWRELTRLRVGPAYDQGKLAKRGIRQKRNAGSLSMKRVMSQGHAMRSTRALSRVTHFMDGSFPWRGALRVRAVGLAQGRLEPLGKLDGLVIRPEVHVE